MIYGLIPVGGKGTRLGLPFSKEMLPQKGFDYYNPIINHVVEKMKLAGAQQIVFVHGYDFKQDVLRHFNGFEHLHVLQQKLGFANVIRDLYTTQDLQDEDKVLFGLPDSVFDKNPYVEMLEKSGIVCGLFKTNNYSKVDRLDVIHENAFHVKSAKGLNAGDWFWGILKFDGTNIKKMIEDKAFDRHTEIGHILNMYDMNFIHGERYLDLGTWINYNRYLSDNTGFSNVEIEKKYDATHVNIDRFIERFAEHGMTYYDITSKDFYFTLNNPTVEFIRYRESSQDEGAVPDITIKNFNKSQLNRFELSVPLSQEATSHNVKHMLSLLGAKFEFVVEKHCHIFKAAEYTVVMYTFTVHDHEFKIIEVELNTIDFNILCKVEDMLCDIDGFDVTNTIHKSKFQMIKEYYDSAS